MHEPVKTAASFELLSQYRSNWKTLFEGNLVKILIKRSDSTSLVWSRTRKGADLRDQNLGVTDLREVKFCQGELGILPAILTNLTGKYSRPPGRRRASKRR